MCGRYTARLGSEAFREFFGIQDADLFLTPRFNIAPTQVVPIVLEESGRRRFVPMRWGLEAPWASKEKSPPVLINARGETLGEKPTFKRLLEQRCAVPADGYFEWLDRDGKKVPYYIHLAPLRAMAFAGLWQEKEGRLSFTIITIDAAPPLATVHHRMPVILTQESDLRLWLTGPFAQASEIVRPSREQFTLYEVASIVNNSRHDDVSCIRPVESAQKAF